MEADYTLAQLREEIIKFKNDPEFQKLENFYYSKSFSEILGVSRREISHSGFIAWLLKDNESHSLRDYPIKKLLDIVVKFSSEQLRHKHSDLYNAFISEDFTITQIFVRPEYSIKGIGRVDIYLEFVVLFSGRQVQIKIIVENKVKSGESNDQTRNYYNYFNALVMDNDVVFYLYLTPLSTLALKDLTEPQCNCKEFIQINYQSLVDYIIEPALNQSISEQTRTILTEYLKSLSQPSLDEENEDYKSELIMALGNEERKLLSSFWNKNQKLILAALYAISSDPEHEEETRTRIREALDQLSSERDRSTFNIKYDGEIYAANFKKSDLGLKTVSLLKDKGLIDDEVIGYIKQDKSCSFPLVKKKEEFTETEIKYRKYKTNDAPELIYKGEEFYVARNWGISNTDKFIDKFTEKFPGLKYETNNK